jgi:hypothetical protein
MHKIFKPELSFAKKKKKGIFKSQKTEKTRKKTEKTQKKTEKTENLEKRRSKTVGGFEAF